MRWQLAWLILLLNSISWANANSCNSLPTCFACNTYVDVDGTNLCSWCVRVQSCVPRSGLECLFGDKITEFDDCPRPEAPGVYYNDTFARNEMFAISAAAYFDHPQDCMNNFIEGAVVRTQVTVPYDQSSSDSCSAFTAISTTRKAMILGFRGTENTMQLFLESWETVMADRVELIGGGEVSSYFYNAFQRVWVGGIRKDLLDMIRLYPGYELWISGHSLGGAMAAIASSVIANGKFYDGKYIKLVTFGQPRTGNHDFVAAHDSKVFYSYRVTHRKDIVVHLPTRSYRNYHHHRYEIWYDNDMKEGDPYVQCYTPDDNSCSDSNTIDTSISDHKIYFNKAIGWIGDTGCI